MSTSSTILLDTNEIFNKLDVDKCNVLTRDSFKRGLDLCGHSHITDENVDELFNIIESKHGVLTRHVFRIYLDRHQFQLLKTFNTLDKNKDGKVSKNEITNAFTEMGISLTDREAEYLNQRICGEENTTGIGFEEWRDFLLFHPSPQLRDIVRSLKNHLCSEFGEDISLPDDFSCKEIHTGMWWRHLVAGGVAGAFSRTVTAPIDRIKIFFQVHGTRKSLHIGSTVKYMLNEGGLACFWRGNFINVLKIAPENAIKFGAYEFIKRQMKGDSDRQVEIYERFLAGSLAGALAQSVIFPMEVVKIRMALRKTNEYRNSFHCIHRIYKHGGGVKAFYRGYTPNLLGIIPYAGIDLTVFETLNRRMNTNATTSPMTILTIGAFSSCCGQLAAYPFAVIRTKLQSQAGLKIDIPKEQTTPYQLFKYIYKNEGIHGLYRGLIPNMCKVAPAMGVSYIVYDIMRDALGIEMT